MSGEDHECGKDNSCGSCGQAEPSHVHGHGGGDERHKETERAIARRMEKIKHKIVVLSGKGGVGKSTVAVNLAAGLLSRGLRVGLMDIDLHGPSIAGLITLKDRPDRGVEGGIRPAVTPEGLKAVSIGFFMESRDEAVIWRGPMKHGVIRQFLSEVEWGDLDFLIVDSPPGTGDEPLSVVQSIGRADGAVIVTTPQDVSVNDVRRSIGFCRRLKLPVLGVVENMSGFVCPHCGEPSDIFKRGGGAALSDQMKVPFLGAIPIDPEVVEACDVGTPYLGKAGNGAALSAFEEVVERILRGVEKSNT